MSRTIKDKKYVWLLPLLLLLWLMAHNGIYAEETEPVSEPTLVESSQTDPEPQEASTQPSENEAKETPAVDTVEIQPETDSPILEESQIQTMNVISSAPVKAPVKHTSSISYQAHVQKIGWQSQKKDSQTAGTTGQSKRVEALCLQLDSQAYSGKLEYRSYIQGKGWESTWKSNRQISGTTGQGRYIEAIQIRLTGQMAEYYDIYYRVHIQSYGWLDWASDGSYAGSRGLNKRIEALQIRLVEKGQSNLTTNRENVGKDVQYSTHVQRYGWQAYLRDGQTAGTTGKSLRLEAIRCSLFGQEYSGNIMYRTHVQRYGWMNWVTNGSLSGTTGQSKRLEAIEIKLTGELANHYDVYYRVHAQNYGWLDWARNGAPAGTAGLSYRLEGIEIQLVEKGKPAMHSVNTISYVNKDTAYTNNTKVSEGWQRMNGNYYHTTSSGIIQKNTLIADGSLYGYLDDRGRLITSNSGIFMHGIDISEHNGNIDLSKYKNGFVIIRVSWDTVTDKKAIRNMDLCEKLGIPYGVYCYSYALTTAQAKAEADYLLSVIKGRNIQVGVWYDMEDADHWKARNNALTAEKMTNFCNTFCSHVESKGYFTGVYSSASWFTTYLSGLGNYARWVAHWGKNDGTLNVNTSSMGILQQYTSVPLDKNVMYVPLSAFKKR